MPACSSKSKTISPPLSCESGGGWKGLSAYFSPSLHISQRKAVRGGEPGWGGWLLGTWVLAAWVLLLASLCTLFDSSCLRSQPGTLLLSGEKECSRLALFWDEVAGPVETQQSERIKFRSCSFHYLCPGAEGLVIILVFIFQAFLFCLKV